MDLRRLEKAPRSEAEQAVLAAMRDWMQKRRANTVGELEAFWRVVAAGERYVAEQQGAEPLSDAADNTYRLQELIYG